MKTKKRYLFGMNFNPIAREDEQYLTQVEVPADSEEEAWERLKALVGSVVAKKCWLNDIREY